MADYHDKKLVIVTPSFKGGGAEKVAVNLANQYANEGFDVVLIAVSQEGPYRELVSNKVDVVDVKSRTFIRSLYLVFLELNKHKGCRVLSVIRDTNIIVGLSRFLVNVDSMVFREANTYNHIASTVWYKKLAWMILLRISYSKANFVIANSLDTKKDLLDFKIVKDSKIKVINNPVLPVNVDELLEEELNHRWFSDPKYKVVLNVGRLHKQKNQSLLLVAFSKVVKKKPFARLVILGEGPEEEGLYSLAEELDISDKFEIISFKKNPFPYYKGAEVFVLSSAYEGFGNVVVEALSSGNPVISTDCAGGPKSILDNGGYGAIVRDRDEKALSDAIFKILSGELSFRPSELKERSEKYSIKKISSEYKSVIFNLNS